ncbi:unnamed protein product [Orchesella dallaii]|uniref:Kazal-like domain-containing protein n=1 Tax=Orchesella dallaii TaxID=48710 RepID=A0ABP1RPJ3_9HEXA
MKLQFTFVAAIAIFLLAIMSESQALPEPDGEKPCICPFIRLEVCGADNKTYPNDCLRRCKGVELSHEGPCKD